MVNTLILKLIGVASLVVGLALVWSPELISNKPIPNDVYQAIERRIWWGLLIGLGLLLLFHHKLLPWQPTVAATLSALLLGLMIARLIGILLDGSVAKQWTNLAIEFVFFLPLLWWYIRTQISNPISA